MRIIRGDDTRHIDRYASEVGNCDVVWVYIVECDLFAGRYDGRDGLGEIAVSGRHVDGVNCNMNGVNLTALKDVGNVRDWTLTEDAEIRVLILGGLSCILSYM